MKHSVRYHTLDAWLRSRHGEKVQKIPLDAGSSCPNRDGTLGVTGCTFCNAIASLRRRSRAVNSSRCCCGESSSERESRKIFIAY